MSQRDLAREFQVSSAAIAQWETGTREVPGSVLKLISLYEKSLQRISHLEQNSTIPQLEKYFEAGENAEKRKALKLLEREFASYSEEQSYLNSLESRVKQILIERLMKSVTKSYGVSAKIAQLASFLELGLPHEVRNALGTLQSRSTPMDKKVIRNILLKEYGKDFKKTFTFWRDEPLAVTSLGQVHYARLADGKEVAVKIQHPDISQILDSQLSKIEFIESMTALLGYKKADLLLEVRNILMRECDYRQEALNQDMFRKILSDRNDVIIPKVYHEFLRDRVLVTEYIRGKSFQNFVLTALPGEKNKAAETIIESLATAVFGHCLIQSDLHPGNFLFVDGKVVLLDFGRIIVEDPENIKTQSLMYLAWLNGEYEKARILASESIFAKDPNFDFDRFWSMLSASQVHLMDDTRFHFTRSYAKYVAQVCRTYAKQGKMTLDRELLWATIFSISTWGLYADLDARVNFRRIAFKTMQLGLAHSVSKAPSISS